jgi:hypothetical protein
MRLASLSRTPSGGEHPVSHVSTLVQIKGFFNNLPKAESLHDQEESKK